MNSFWFLDLEETIINSLDDPRMWCNVSKLKKLLSENDVKQISIFLFAIWSPKI
ncbi:MAG: hypothetical protein QXG00_07450 [Candidatus Woesearchaeota archaeon]